MKRFGLLFYYVALAGLVVAAVHALDLLFTFALALIAVGLWWERPSLALIVPGAVVLLLCVCGRLGMLRGD